MKQHPHVLGLQLYASSLETGNNTQLCKFSCGHLMKTYVPNGALAVCVCSVSNCLEVWTSHCYNMIKMSYSMDAVGFQQAPCSLCEGFGYGSLANTKFVAHGTCVLIWTGTYLGHQYSARCSFSPWGKHITHVYIIWALSKWLLASFWDYGQSSGALHWTCTNLRECIEWVLI